MQAPLWRATAWARCRNVFSTRRLCSLPVGIDECDLLLGAHELECRILVKFLLFEKLHFHALQSVLQEIHFQENNKKVKDRPNRKKSKTKHIYEWVYKLSKRVRQNDHRSSKNKKSAPKYITSIEVQKTKNQHPSTLLVFLNLIWRVHLENLYSGTKSRPKAA